MLSPYNGESNGKDNGKYHVKGFKQFSLSYYIGETILVDILAVQTLPKFAVLVVFPSEPWSYGIETLFFVTEQYEPGVYSICLGW